MYEKIVDYVKNLMNTIQNDMFERAKARRDSQTYEAHNLEEVEEIMNNHPGFIKAMWCGDSSCEEKIKEIKGTKSRCIPFDNEQEKVSDKCVCCGKEAKTMVVWGIQY